VNESVQVGELLERKRQCSIYPSGARTRTSSR
jgi:hypothetical protein